MPVYPFYKKRGDIAATPVASARDAIVRPNVRRGYIASGSASSIPMNSGMLKRRKLAVFSVFGFIMFSCWMHKYVMTSQKDG
jgi:hypothetical protein